ncbi:SELP [Lepeophtheirus salmonis]|uniref:SELP n=1 Tax=Lepeophtheirus salmonis TaxID=72036 RepID=A0A7R8HBS3_LEPSM|nr:SELP [Lepeophtheirus salmonis]CAF2992775.1 SELP [Lepeophtheirus salmonis]
MDLNLHGEKMEPPEKRLKTDAVPILPLSTSTVPKPEDQCDKKFPKNLHESTFSQTLSSVDNQERTNQDCLEIFFTRLRSAGGDDDHPGAVGAMKRMIILEFGKNCETLMSNPAPSD